MVTAFCLLKIELCSSSSFNTLDTFVYIGIVCVWLCARVYECVYHYVNCNPGGKMKTNISYVLIPPPPQIHITLPFLFSWMSLKDLCLLRQKK